MYRIIALFLTVLFSLSVYAQDEPAAEAAPPKKLSGEGGLGLIINSGNTDNESLNGNLKAAYKTSKWKHSFGIDARKTTENNSTTAERYLLTEKSDYKFGERTYAFGAFRYDDDRFSGFEYQASITAGIGWHIIKRENTHLDLEVGAGYRENKIDATGLTEDETIGRLAGHFDTLLTESTSFTQDLLVESGEENTSSESVTGIKVAMNKTLALKFTYTVKHNSDPPAGNESTDRTTAVTLVYSF